MSFPTIPGLSEAQERWDNLLPPEDSQPKCACGHILADHDLTIDFESEDLCYDDACRKCEKSCLGFELAYDRRHSMDGPGRFRDRVHVGNSEDDK